MSKETKKKRYSSSSTTVERRLTRSQGNDSQKNEHENDSMENVDEDLNVKKENKNKCEEKKDNNNNVKQECKSIIEKKEDNSNIEKKEDPPEKTVNPAECQNDRAQFHKHHKPFSFKSPHINPVITNMYRSQGFATASDVSRTQKEVIINQIKKFQSFKAFSPFDRRTTAMTWHPTYQQIFIAASKGGDLMLHNLHTGDDYFSPGIGASGTIFGLVCSKEKPYNIYTAGLEGKITWHDLYKQKSDVLLSLSYSWDKWFTSIDKCPNQEYILSGDCKGNIYLVSTTGQRVWRPCKKVHASKVTHCEFNTHYPHIVLTSSNDHTVKLWDLRKFTDLAHRPVPVATFRHGKPVNAAYFSPSNRLNILTTDQHSELRIYKSPLYSEVIKITHPHRHFRHMTNIKAIWHPLEDIVIVGRYPDDNVEIDDSRTIDFYDGSNGKLLHRMPSPTKNIVSLNAMSSAGDVLACSAGFTITLLKDEYALKEDKYESEAASTKATESAILNLYKKEVTKELTINLKRISTETNISPKKKFQ